MMTLDRVIKAWNAGDTDEAYRLFLRDEGCIDRGYSLFCQNFPNLIKRHKEMIEILKADSKFDMGE